MIILIAAIGPNRELGFNNQLIYHSKEDMGFFKERTKGGRVIMGTNTLKSIGHPLPDRVNYVITHHPENLPAGTIPAVDLAEFLEKVSKDEEIYYVIGGASIYAQALDFAEHLYLTEFTEPREADCFFPEFNPALYDKKKIKDISGGAIYDYEYHPWKIKPNYVLV